ncbi:MAG: hydrogenase maturation protease [Bacteroidetes bacterium]|nr:hydrogenase maturation protease [Bacteroidota bacterium]
MQPTDTSPLAISSDAYFFEKDKSECTLILGVGNYLMGDEGVGVHLIRHLSDKKLPENVDILDGGTGGFLLLNCIESYKNVIFVDATMDGKPDGTICLIKPKFASDFPSALSVHDVGLKDMIEALYILEKAPNMFLFTVSISKIDPMSVSLSASVCEALKYLPQKIFNLIAQQNAQ